MLENLITCKIRFFAYIVVWKLTYNCRQLIFREYFLISSHIYYTNIKGKIAKLINHFAAAVHWLLYIDR